MTMQEIVLMDGRARFDIDKAIVVSAAWIFTLETATKEAKERGDDTVVVDLVSRTVLWAPEMESE